jgi:hypothetical protein
VYDALLDYNRRRVSIPEIAQAPAPAAEPLQPEEPRAESTAKQRYAAQHAPLKPRPAAPPSDDDGAPAKEW